MAQKQSNVVKFVGDFITLSLATVVVSVATFIAMSSIVLSIYFIYSLVKWLFM